MVRRKDGSGSENGDSRGRVWMGYHPSRSYGQELCSFAWAQAVKNKPLGLDVKEEEEEMLYEVDDDDAEKEEGELEEGEIELGSEPVTNGEPLKPENGPEPEQEKKDNSDEDDMGIGEFDQRVGLILEELENITAEESESDFEGVCSRLHKSFASMKQLFSESTREPVLDLLVEQAFTGIQTVYSVYSSGNLKMSEKNRDLFLRLLIHIKNQYSVFLTPEQVKEMDDIVRMLASEAEKPRNMEKLNDPTFPSTNSNYRAVHSVGGNNISAGLTKSRPLINLHADYDEDSLPSPTRDSAPPLPFMKPAQPMPTKNVEVGKGTLHTYVTNAFKDVSSYQQKYGRNSVHASNQLPSPTPSEDGNDGPDDSQGEVSSSLIVGYARPLGFSSGGANAYTSSGLQFSPGQQVGQQSLGPSPVMRASAKSRDPRIKFMNPEVDVSANSRKNKAWDEPLQDGNALKRQRNASAKDFEVATGNGGLMGNSIRPNDNVAMNANVSSNGLNAMSMPNPVTSSAPASISLPSLLKDLAVNPGMLLELLKMEKQRLAADTLKKVDIPASTKPLEVDRNPATKAQIPPQSISLNAQNEAGGIRMKPRDPRRILHTNLVQNSDNGKPEAPTTLPSQPTLLPDFSSQFTNNLKKVADIVSTSQPGLLPDISSPFTKNPKNVTDVVSTSQSTIPLPVGPPNVGQAIQSKINKDSSEQETVSISSSLRPVNAWGDVDHLLDGYDNQEKAAIQKERARRIAEQNKMFSQRKLCLVLDLDHTLLNSAKFTEVDPVHEEILRKKEELDRENPERHLFWFQHMGMWTKLRPGVWKFLEKASKLFELHVYTMGNKLYATEMAKVLDPTGTLFSGRVISKGDEGEPVDGDKNKDLEGVLGMESAVVIIDDTVRVWPHHKLNLIVVERYTYFPCSRRQFGLMGPSLLEIDRDERPEDGTLASSLAVIERIHHNFFSHRSLNEVDVRNILAAEQRKILAGCKIVFSRVFPVGEANPHLHPLWQTAEQFGAECNNQIDEHVTHVVANSRGTDKVNWALSTGRFVVHPGWVEASALLYRRANEQDFAVK